jgi:ABC-type enterochelin transport system substrate-binding protein
MNEKNNVWLKTDEEKLRALLADEAKNIATLYDLQETVKQLKAKSSFRIALINQLLEDQGYKPTK